MGARPQCREQQLQNNNNMELKLEVDGDRDRRDLKGWDEEIWNNPAVLEDVKKEVPGYLQQL